MNRVTSSLNAQTKKLPQSQPQPQPPAKKERCLKRERLPVNPLRGFTTRSSGSSSCSNGSGSGSTSGEASNGCHRFLLSHSFSSSSSTSSSLGVFTHGVGSNRPVRSVTKTPKSAPVVSKPLIRKKPRFLEETKLKSTVTDKPQRFKTNPLSGKRLTGKITMKPEKASVLKKQSSVSREVKLKDSQTTIRVDDSIAQITPVSKLGAGSDLIYRSSNDEATDDGRVSSSYEERTPPVQASISPEIQCGSSSMTLSASAQSQACYAAGHLLSGVSDKRKCKPKGILTVGENGFEVGNAKILNDSDEFDEGDFGNGGNYDNISTMPLPADASVHWVLSPCDEEKETEIERYDDGFSQFQQVVECVGHETPSPLSDRSTSSDLCNISSGKSLSPVNLCKETVRRTSSSLSPNELSRFRRFMQLSSCEGVASAFELDPSEDLKGDKLSSPLSVDTLGSENVIQTPESNSSFDKYLGLLRSQDEFQKKLEDGTDIESLRTTLESARLSPRSHAPSREPSSSSFNFDSLATSSDSIDLSQFQRGFTRDRVSRTQVRVSRSGKINSHMPELKFQQITDNKEGSAPARKGRELLPCSAAESISTDGGGLVCSEDSNWMECYKN